MKQKNILLALILSAGFSISVFCGNISTEDPLVKMRLNEKLAYDLYADFSDMWKLDVFSSIGESKVVHKMRMKSLLKKLGIKDPVENNFDRGSFENEEFNKIYRELILRGSVSETEALKACAYNEERIIKELTDCISYVSDETLEKTLLQMNLTTGAHLRALVKAINRKGDLYSPQILTEGEFDAVMGSGRDNFTYSEE